MHEQSFGRWFASTYEKLLRRVNGRFLDLDLSHNAVIQACWDLLRRGDFRNSIRIDEAKIEESTIDYKGVRRNLVAFAAVRARMIATKRLTRRRAPIASLSALPALLARSDEGTDDPCVELGAALGIFASCLTEIAVGNIHQAAAVLDACVKSIAGAEECPDQHARFVGADARSSWLTRAEGTRRSDLSRGREALRACLIQYGMNFAQVADRTRLPPVRSSFQRNEP